MKKIIIIFLNLIVNTLTGFYIFACAFNGQNFSLINVGFLCLSVGVVLGIVSGAVLKTSKILEVLISILPLLGFFSLFIQGSIEQGGPKEIATAFLIFVMPVAFEGGSWFLSAFISKHFQK
jgi:hypothetical protein